MSTVGKRLSKVVENEASSLQDFCNKFDFSYTSMQPILTDKRILGTNILKKLIEKFPYLTSDYILFGRGNINYTENGVNVINEPSPKYDDDIVEKMFLEYLERPNVRKSLKNLIENVIDEKK